MNEVQDQYARQAEQAGTLTLDDRILKHKFSPAFFQLKNLELNLQFKCVTDQPLRDLVLIEKHFFRDQIISEFEFAFPACIPNSTNTW